MGPATAPGQSDPWQAGVSADSRPGAARDQAGGATEAPAMPWRRIASPMKPLAFCSST